MINSYNNIVNYNQEISHKWLLILIFFMIMKCIPGVSLLVYERLFPIVFGMLIVSSYTSSKYNFFSKFAAMNSFIGIIFVTIFLLKIATTAVLSKLFPIYNNLFFIIGIGMFFSGVIVQSLILIVDKFKLNNFSIIVLAFIIIFALLSFFITFYILKASLIGNISFDYHKFYNIVLYAMSYILCFFFIHLFILCTNRIVSELYSNKIILTQYELNALSLFNIFAVIISFSSFLIYDVSNDSFLNFYNQHLKIFGGILLGLFVLKVLIFIFHHYKKLSPDNSKIYFLKKTLIVSLLGILIVEIFCFREAILFTILSSLNMLILASLFLEIIKTNIKKTYKLANMAMNLNILLIILLLVESFLSFTKDSIFVLLKWLPYYIFLIDKQLNLIMYLVLVSSQAIFIIIFIRFFKEKNNGKETQAN